MTSGTDGADTTSLITKQIDLVSTEVREGTSLIRELIQTVNELKAEVRDLRSALAAYKPVVNNEDPAPSSTPSQTEVGSGANPHQVYESQVDASSEQNSGVASSSSVLSTATGTQSLSTVTPSNQAPNDGSTSDSVVAPKRATSAFMFFCKDRRDRVRAENPGATFGGIGKLLIAEWNELGDEQKAPYIEQAAEDEARYVREKGSADSAPDDPSISSSFIAPKSSSATELPTPPSGQIPSTTATAAKDRFYPRRPLTAFMYFSQDWRDRVKAENPGASFIETGKLLGDKWRELDDEEKTRYIEQAAEDKARYEREKEIADSAP